MSNHQSSRPKKHKKTYPGKKKSTQSHHRGAQSKSSSRQNHPRQGHSNKGSQSEYTTQSKNPFQNGRRLTLFGRKPVFEALSDPRITSQKLFIAHQARGELIDDILRLAQSIALPIERRSALELSRISKHGKQDQGVALDVEAPLHQSLKERLQSPLPERPIFLLDGLNTPANLGLLIRSAWAAGAAGIILPKHGCAPLNPLAVKASAGVAIHAPIWTCQSAEEAISMLKTLDLPIYGLAGEASASLYDRQWPQRSVWIIGNESHGMSETVREALSEAVSLPMFNDVESLNAAVASSIVAFELGRQRVAHA